MLIVVNCRFRTDEQRQLCWSAIETFTHKEEGYFFLRKELAFHRKKNNLFDQET